jgi:hypothetical protein
MRFSYKDFQQARHHLRHLVQLGFFGPPVVDFGSEAMVAREEKLFSDFWPDLERRVEALLREHCPGADCLRPGACG